jgi:NADH:ubiquinone oxidoreductase subunit D
MIAARELVMRIIESLTGARLTVTYVRIGGVKHDLLDEFAARVAYCSTRSATTGRKIASIAATTRAAPARAGFRPRATRMPVIAA